MPAGLMNPIPAARKAEETIEPDLVLTVSREMPFPPRLALFAPPDPVARAALLDYAAFVLDQEAKYCQQ